MSDIYNSTEYKNTRKAYMAQCTIEYIVSILVADAYLAKLLTSIGISDAMTGIISSFISLAFVFQLLSIFLVEKMTNVKKTVIICDTISQLFFLSIYLVPFLPFQTSIKTILVIVAVLIAYIAKYLIYSIFFKWANSFVAPDNRGEYSAVKEIISLVSGLVFTFVLGFIVDKFESVGHINGAFLFIAIIMLLLNVLNFISIMKIKNIKIKNTEHHSFQLVIKKTLGNRNFISVIVLTALWDMARYMTVGFMGTYKTNDLLLTVGAVQLINIAASVFRVIVSKPFGRYSDKTSYARGFGLALLIAAAGFAFNVFSAPDRIWCVVVYTILYNICTAGTNQNAFNITYSYVEGDYIVQAMAVKNSIGGLLGFGASLLGSRILMVVQSNGNSLFGISLYGQQLLSVISLLITMAALIFNHLIIEKQKVIRQ